MSEMSILQFLISFGQNPKLFCLFTCKKLEKKAVGPEITNLQMLTPKDEWTIRIRTNT